MKNSPAFQLYAADFYMDTTGWSATQIGIYFRLLMYEWVNGFLPSDTEILARVAQIDHGNFIKCYRPTIERKFYKDRNGNLLNRRMEEVRIKQIEYREHQKNSGLKSARLKREKGIYPFQKANDPLDLGINDALNDVINDHSNEILTNVEPESNSSSSSSSSSSDININSKEDEKSPLKLPSKEEIEEASDSMILAQIEIICIQLYKEKIFPEVNSFKNKMLKEKKNPRSILHTLSRAYIKGKFEEGPWAYCQKIIEIESSKYNARDYGKTS